MMKRLGDEMQVTFFSTVINLYRAISLEPYFVLEKGTWDLLMELLLEIQEEYLVTSQEATSLSPYSKDYARYLVDTIIGVFIRSETLDLSFWKKFASSLDPIRNGRSWIHYIKSWTVYDSSNQVLHAANDKFDG